MTESPKHWGNLTPGHVSFARSFLDAARVQSLPTEYGEASFEPAHLFLLAHSLELGLKCIALWNGKAETDLRSDFGHDLERLLNYANSDSKTRSLIVRAEGTTKEAWRDRLRSERDEYASSTGNAAPDIVTNEAIGKVLDDLTLQKAVQWLNPLHCGKGGSDSAGSALRYFRAAHIEFPQIHASGLHYSSIPVTLGFGCAAILIQLNGKLRAPGPTTYENTPGHF